MTALWTAYWDGAQVRAGGWDEKAMRNAMF